MKERPILFSTLMVQAILDGRKTQTRWQIKIDIRREIEGNSPTSFSVFDKRGTQYYEFKQGIEDEPSTAKDFCPYGGIGDVLWVRETWKEIDGRFIYKADPFLTQEEIDSAIYANIPKWKPSIHMPKSACRLKLRITNIRVERLNDISRGDAMQEGCPFPNVARENDPVNWFIYLWESINGKESWNKNPWVWVIEFEVV